MNLAICYKTEPSWLLSAFIFQDHTIFKDTKLTKIVSEVINGKVMRKSTNKYFAILRIIQVNRGLRNFLFVHEFLNLSYRRLLLLYKEWFLIGWNEFRGCRIVLYFFRLFDISVCIYLDLLIVLHLLGTLYNHIVFYNLQSSLRLSMYSIFLLLGFSVISLLLHNIILLLLVPLVS